MPKIKNWTPKNKWEVNSISVSNQVVGNKVWRHDELNDLVVQIDSTGVKGGIGGGIKYRAYISLGKYNQSLSDDFSSKQKAEKKAIQWMKNNPNPNLEKVFSNL